MTSAISSALSSILETSSSRSDISSLSTTASSPTPTSVSTTTAPDTTSVTSIPPSTTYVPPTTVAPTTVVTSITSIVTQTPSDGGQSAIVTTITSTQPVVTYTPTASEVSTRSSASASASQTALSASGDSASSKGLSSGATIAIAVIIPIAAVIGLVILGIWFWRRRKAKKNAEELRKNEMAEYGFNPNTDPTLPVAAAYTDGGSDGNEDSGYRGWGATSSTARKPSTTLGSNSRAAAMGGGMAISENGSHGYGTQPSPNAPSDDPLVQGYTDAGAGTGAGVAAAVAGGTAAGSNRNRYSAVSSGIHRGPSNASSQYSANGPAMSEAESDQQHMPNTDYYNNEVPYNIYNDVQPGHGPYGDGTYPQQNDQPVIRDVQARRNTRIERAPTFPQQGGISQNF